MARPPRRRNRLAGRIVAVVGGAGVVAAGLVLFALAGEVAGPAAGEDAYLAAVRADARPAAPQAQLVELGRAVCARPQAPRAELVERAGGGRAGAAIVDAARAHLCS